MGKIQIPLYAEEGEGGTDIEFTKRNFNWVLIVW